MHEADSQQPPDPGDQGAARAAVAAAIGEHLLDGVIHDAHGEVQPDPEPDGGDPDSGDPDPDVVARHRQDAASIDAHAERAADGTRGAITRDRPDDG